MRRLVAHIPPLSMLLNQVLDAVDDLNSAYLELFEVLTDVYNFYPDVYQSLKLSVRLPSVADVNRVDQLHDDLVKMVNLYLTSGTSLSTPSVTDSPNPQPYVDDVSNPYMTQHVTDDGDNLGDDQGLPDFQPSVPTPNMSPSSKEPFSDVFRSS